MKPVQKPQPKLLKPQPKLLKPQLKLPKPQPKLRSPSCRSQSCRSDKRQRSEGEGAVKTPEIKGLKVLGKLDFEAQAKEASEKKAAAVVARAKANAEKDKIVVKSALPDIVVSPDVIVEKPSSTLIKTKVEKLTGPKVLGKIVLPVEKKKTKDNGKRKRVRVKVDIEKAKPLEEA